MEGPKIKFCGMTHPDDARAAAELGVDFIGMVLHASSRRTIDLARAESILRVIPPSISAVGLFVDASSDQVLSTAQALGLRYVQLHGSETPDYLTALKSLNVIKALKVQRSTLEQTLAPWKGPGAPAAILLDSGSTAQAGGTGIENDWEAIRDAKAGGVFNGTAPIMLAGGLNPQNVAGVVKLVHPWAVDVSSGIEESVGIKSRQKMAAFVKAVRDQGVLG